MRIRQLLEQYKASGKKAFIPFIMAGDHDLEATEQLILGLEAIGADVIELGIPFSDPVADGPTIIMAGARALRHNVSLRQCLELVQRVRAKNCHIPIILFSYYNPVLTLGAETFIKLAQLAKIDAVLIVDLPQEVGQEFFHHLRQHNIGTIMLASPTTSPPRIIANAKASSEFLYYIARIGTTGMHSEISATLAEEVAMVKSYVDIPVAVGFGISSPEQAKIIAASCDAVIVGSSLVKEMEEADTQQAISNLLQKAKALRQAIV
jgi:tryptophan synthase alpha chain